MIISGRDSISYTQSAGDTQLAINDEVGNAQRELSSYADVISASSNGTIDVTVVGGGTQGGPFVVAGLALDSVESPAQPLSRGEDIPSTVAEPVIAKQAPAAVAAFDFDPDILGIHLGMTIDAARTTLLNLDPPMPNRVVYGDTGAVVGSRLRGMKYRNGLSVANPNGGSVHVFGFAPPNAETVAGVSREENLLDPILYKIFRELLVEKYGNPLFEHTPPYDMRNGGKLVGGIEHILSWSRTPDGTPVTGKNKAKACLGDEVRSLSSIYLLSEPSTDPFRELWHECGTVLIYRFGGRQTPEAMTVFRYNAVL